MGLFLHKFHSYLIQLSRLMGLCFRKPLQEPNQPVDIAQPSTGVHRIQLPQPRTTSTKTSQGRNTQSVFSNSSIKDEKHSKHEIRRGLEETNSAVSSNKRIGTAKGRNFKRHGHPQTPRRWSGKNVNKKGEVWHDYKPHCFCYSALKAATQKFSSKNFLGQGGFGDVYKGYIPFCTMTPAKPDAGFPIAVKRLRKRDSQGYEEWKNEMRFLSKLNHPNIVQLVGFCCDREHRILVYECMPRGNLEDHLLKEDERKLNWCTRIKIALGTARALAYLHTRGKPIIHRDLKASNILLDIDFNPKVSDFGLARYGPEGDNDHVSTRVLGTRGYFAPEYIGTGHLTVKADVYGFGVVLLQILSGSGALKKYSDGTTGNLVQWAEPHFNNQDIHSLVDEGLGYNFPMEEAHRFAELTHRCLCPNPRFRPTIAEVVADLEQLQQNDSNQSSITVATFSSCPPSTGKFLISRGCQGTTELPWALAEAPSI